MDVARDVALPTTSDPTVEDYVDLAQLAESRGYDRVWLGEGWGRDAVTVLATIAAETESIGLGTSILPAFSRSPALAGQTAATLQEVTGGRFRLGVGSGGPPIVEDWHGVPYRRPLRRTREFVEIVDRVLGGETVDYDGEMFDLAGFHLRHEYHDPPPSIDTAAIGPKAVELAGRFADGWHAFLFTPDGLTDRYGSFERGAELGNRNVSDLRATVAVPTCALEDGQHARRLTAKGIAQYIGGMGPHYRDAVASQGYEEVTDAIAEAWRNDDRERAFELVDEELLDSIGIAGTPSEARESLERFTETPADAITIQFPGGAALGEVRETIDILAPD